MLDAARLDGVYDALLAAYGPQGWWPVDGPAETAALEVCIGAILVQHARWESAAAVLVRLREAGALSVEALIHAAGRAPRGVGARRGHVPVEGARAALVRRACARWPRRDDRSLPRRRRRDGATALPRRVGVGPETADAIVLYAARRPTFVVDAYARRLFARLGCELPGGYEPARRALLDATDGDVMRLGEWHALIVAHGKARCLTRAPRCEDCPLLDACPAGQATRCTPVSPR